MKLTRNSIAALTLGFAACAGASADTFLWTWERGDTRVNDRGGTFKSLMAHWNPMTEVLDFEVVFSDQWTEGFTVAINDGPNPKGQRDELALLYFDASDFDNPTVSAYEYNGKNSNTSYKDGDGNIGGNQTPGRIEPAGGSWILDIDAFDMDGMRTLSFSVDASGIQNYSGGSNWSGVAFNELFGIWLHPVKGLTTEYNDDGFLTKWQRSKEGWLDASNLDAERIPMPPPVPLPTGAGLGAAGLMLLGARRRRSA